MNHPTGQTPNTVHIVACGYTKRDYIDAVGQYFPEVPVIGTPGVEVWTLNKACRAIRADLGFVLDDLVAESRINEHYAKEIIDLSKTMPIITCEKTADFREKFGHYTPGIHEYPIREISEKLARWHLMGVESRKAGKPMEITPESVVPVQRRREMAYFRNSLPLIMAYAWAMESIHTLYLWGADYTHPVSGASREADQPNAEYWAGFLRASGIRIIVSQDTTLLKTREPWKVYGYARIPDLT